MLSNKAKKTAKILVEYSTKVKKNENVIISSDIAAKDFALEIYKLVLQKGAYPKIYWSVPGEKKIFYTYAKNHQLIKFPKHLFNEIKDTHVVFNISAPEDLYELANVDAKKIAVRRKVIKPISDWRIEKTRWVIFQYPTKEVAKFAGFSFKNFSDFVFNSCLLNWNSFRKKLNKFKKFLDRVENVRIIGKNTDITFSIKGRNAVIGDGTYNMPDGEVFTSVVENSVEGEIYFEIPAVKYGNVVEGVYLRFKKGKVVKADAEKNSEFLKKILRTDKGAKRIGEFGIGLNYKIYRATKQILFDEKIGGTIHLALGKSYKETKGKNNSAIHWDFIKDLRKNGKVYFDDKLVMQKGKWKFFN
jgi:aminopeptidase